MNRLIYILAVMAMLCFVSCSGKEDEPEIEYTGPWEIYYEESFYGMHNNSSEFVNWFNTHNQFFEYAKFQGWDGNWFTYNGYIDLQDYKNLSGDILWIEQVQHASEDDMKAKVALFESFSVEDNINRHYDRFYASYRRIEEQK